METIEIKAVRGIRTFLERKSFEILEEGWTHGSDTVDFIAWDEGDLVFINCQVSRNRSEGFPEEKVDRDALERVAIAYLADRQAADDCTFRFDLVSMMIVVDDEVLLRHHRNALSEV
ncbi:MAG: endonuclease [Coriobacteriaceae bacterium]|nr:MAG: endonuclease [Coriobacteriaceae bacterium]